MTFNRMRATSISPKVPDCPKFAKTASSSGRNWAAFRPLTFWVAAQSTCLVLLAIFLAISIPCTGRHPMNGSVSATTLTMMSVCSAVSLRSQQGKLNRYGWYCRNSYTTSISSLLLFSASPLPFSFYATTYYDLVVLLSFRFAKSLIRTVNGFFTVPIHHVPVSSC